MADLRTRVDTMGQLVEQSVLQKNTTGDRIETVLTAATLRKPDERVIDGLINSMAFDPSVNVRLNAINALYSTPTRTSSGPASSPVCRARPTPSSRWR